MLGQFVSHFSQLTQGLRDGEAGARLTINYSRSPAVSTELDYELQTACHVGFTIRNKFIDS